MFLYSRAGSSYLYKKKGMICIKTKPLVWRIAITIAVAAFSAAALICLRPYRYCAANLPPFAAYREFYRGMPMEDCRAALFAENDGTRVCWEQDGALYHVYAAGSYLVFSQIKRSGSALSRLLAPLGSCYMPMGCGQFSSPWRNCPRLGAR